MIYEIDVLGDQKLGLKEGGEARGRVEVSFHFLDDDSAQTGKYGIPT